MKYRRRLKRPRHQNSSRASAAGRTARLKLLVIALFLSSAVLAGFGGLAISQRESRQSPSRQRLFLSKEYIYSDSRVLAVEDAGAATVIGDGFANRVPPEVPEETSTKEAGPGSRRDQKSR